MSADVNRDARLCTEVLGEPLTAYLTGADVLSEYRRWLAGDDESRRRIAPRLAAGRRVIQAFRADDATAMAQPWIREAGVAGGHMPARLIRDKGDDEAVGADLADAAARWLSARRSALRRDRRCEQ